MGGKIILKSTFKRAHTLLSNQLCIVNSWSDSKDFINPCKYVSNYAFWGCNGRDTVMFLMKLAQKVRS